MMLMFNHQNLDLTLRRHVNKRLWSVAQTCLIAIVAGVLIATSAVAADSQSNSSNASTSSSDRSSAGSASGNATSRAPFSAFKIITATNIFNTKRQAGYRASSATAYVRPRSVESFGLVGVMTYEKGPFAFFEGSGSDYQKVLKPDETIAGFKVGEIQSGSVKLISPTNELELKVGMQLTRADGGPWQLGQRAENLESQITYKAQPAAPREEQQQQDTPFGFPPPGGFPGLPDAIAQGIQGALQGGAPGGQQPVIIQAPNGQNGTAVIQQNGAAGAPDTGDVLQRLIRRRQQQEQGN